MEIPYGYCHCGCGNKTRISDKTDRTKGHTKGEPLQYLRFHWSSRMGAKSKSWKGGRVKHVAGYICVQAPTHPKANHGYVLEHILVAEQMYGGPLPKGYEVHHKNGDKANNDPSNLAICKNHAEHMAMHVAAKALAACGDATWRKCSVCGKYDKPENLYIRKQHCYHRRCKHPNPKNITYVTHNGRTQSVNAWAKEMGLNRETVAKRFAKTGSILPCEKNVLRGESARMAKLTPSDVKEIRAYVSKGTFTKTELGRMYAVSRTAIHKIANGDTWGHL